jgi:hypothetical protein
MVPFGLTLPSNHFWLEFLSPFSLHLCLSLGRSNRNGRKWWNWGMSCRRCQSRVTFELGIICTTYGVHRGHFPACDGAWCGTCFTAHPLDCFKVKMPRDFNGASLAELEDKICFREAVPGTTFVYFFNARISKVRTSKDGVLIPHLLKTLYLSAWWSKPPWTPFGQEHPRQLEITSERSGTWPGMEGCFNIRQCRF